MKRVEPLQDFDQIKILSDPRRMDILRLLMASPASLTQLARTLKQSPAWIRHHLLALQGANLIELTEIRTRGKIREKYYRAHAGAFLLQEMILPKGRKPAMIVSGSHDLALEAIADHLARHLMLLSLPVGSLDGLMNLRQGLCQIAGAHLLDENGEYNTPFVRRFFPDRSVEIVTLANRTQGLMVAPGNPKSIKSISDLARADVRFINRNPGSGTRLWFDRELKRAGLEAEMIRGYERDVKTHSEAASLVQSAKADAALGLQAAAHLHGLGFLPLFEERFDLVLPGENVTLLSPLLDYLQTASFRHDLHALTGYSSAHSGQQIPL